MGSASKPEGIRPEEHDPTTPAYASHQQELGFDPEIGNFRAAEAETGLRIEKQLGVRLTRAPKDASHDWTDSTGRTYDSVGNFDAKYFDKQWANGRFQGQILKHMNEKAEIVPVDVSKFTPDQIVKIDSFIKPLGPNVFKVGE
jgi:hypothetical protein